MASTIQIKRGTGSAVPSGLADGELAINLDNRRLYFGSGSTSVNDFSFGEITAEKYIVSSSVLYVTTSFSSGSTEFGDTADDTHTFTGHITASGGISASGVITTNGNITGNNLLIDTIELGLTSIGDTTIARSGAGQITVEGTAVLLAGAQTGITTIFKENLKIGEDTQTAIDFETVNEIHFDANNAEVMNLNTLGINLTGAITASGNISASGAIIGNIGTFNDLGHITASGNINSDGTISGSTLRAPLLAVDTAILGTLTTSGDADILGNIELGDQNDTTIARSAAGAITVEDVPVLLQGLDTLVGHITSSGNISASGVITAEGLTITDDAFINDNLTVTGDISTNNFSLAGVISHVGNTDTKITFGHSDSITFSAGGTDLLILSEAATDTIALGAAISTHITASGHISASGNNYAGEYYTDGYTSLATNGTQGRVFSDADITEIQIGRNGSSNRLIELLGPVTASGNVSASGNIITDQILLDGGNKIIGHHGTDGFQIRSQNSDPIVFKTNGNNIRATISSTGEATFTNVVNATKLNTGQGDNELYAMNQDVETTDNVLFNNITATGNVSSSGYVYGNRIYVGPLIFGVSPSADTLQIGFDTDIDFLTYGKNNSTSHLFKGHITASNGSGGPACNISATGNISASGQIAADVFHSNGAEVGLHTGGVTYLGFNNDTPIQIGKNPGSATTFTGNITASGDISASLNSKLYASSASFGGAAFLRSFNVKGAGLDGRLSLQGASTSDNPGIEMTVNDNTSRVLMRLNPIGSNGTELAIFTEPDGGNIAEAITVESDGNLELNSHDIKGINNVTASGTILTNDLHVSVAGQASLDLIDTGGQAYKFFVRNSDDVFGIYDTTNTQTFFRYTGHATPASTKLALLEAGGKVGIGTTTPSQALEVAGHIKLSGGLLSDSDMLYTADADGGSNSKHTFKENSATLLELSGVSASFAVPVKDGGRTIVKILPTDFVANDGGRPVQIEDDSIGSNELFAFSHSDFDMYAYIEIPYGMTATHVKIFGSNTGENFTVYEANITNKTIAQKCSATAIESEADITDVPWTDANYLVILITSAGATDEIHGGFVTITPS